MPWGGSSAAWPAARATPLLAESKLSARTHAPQWRPESRGRDLLGFGGASNPLSCGCLTFHPFPTPRGTALLRHWEASTREGEEGTFQGTDAPETVGESNGRIRENHLIYTHTLHKILRLKTTVQKRDLSFRTPPGGG